MMVECATILVLSFLELFQHTQLCTCTPSFIDARYIGTAVVVTHIKVHGCYTKTWKERCYKLGLVLSLRFVASSAIPFCSHPMRI